MTSSFSSTAFRERMQAAAANRDRSTPTPVPLGPNTSRKRPHDGQSSPTYSDDERDDSLTPLLALSTSGPATRNAANVVKNYAKKQKLRGDQMAQLDTFLSVSSALLLRAFTEISQDSATVREGKLFTLLLGLHNDVGTIVVAAPPFAVSPELKVRCHRTYHIPVFMPAFPDQYSDLRSDRDLVTEACSVPRGTSCPACMGTSLFSPCHPTLYTTNYARPEHTQETSIRHATGYRK